MIATIPVGSYPFGAAANPTTHRIYVTNRGSGTVSVINGTTNTVIATIPVGINPMFIAVNPNTNRIYVPNNGSGTLSVIDGATNAVVATVTGFSYPEGVAVHPGRNLIYVAHNGNKLTVINGANNTIVGVLDTGTWNHSVGVNANTDRAYVCRTAPFLTAVMNLATNTKITDLGVGGHLAVNPDTNRIYIASLHESVVTVIDGATNGTITTISRDSVDGIPAVNPSTNCVYAPNPDNDTLTVINGATNAAVGTISTGLGYGVYSAAVDSGNGLVYVTNRNSNTVSVIQDTICQSPSLVLTAPRAGVRPVIDGNLTEWHALDQTLLDKDNAATITGDIPTYADLSAGLRAAWAPEMLYFAAAIADDVLVGNNSPNPWNDDVIELSIRVGSATHQFTVAADGRQADLGEPITSLTVMTRTVAGGWTLEVGVPAAALGLAQLQASEHPFTFGLWDDDLFTRPGQTHMIWQGDSTFDYQPDWGALDLSSTIHDFLPGCDATPTPHPPFAGALPPTAVINNQVAHCMDDAHERTDIHEVFVDWEFVRTGGRPDDLGGIIPLQGGFVFRDVRIPQGARIISATLQLNARYQSGFPLAMLIAGDDRAMADDFNPANLIIDSRPRTAARVPWTLTTSANGWLASPDIAAILQELVTRVDWQPRATTSACSSTRLPAPTSTPIGGPSTAARSAPPVCWLPTRLWPPRPPHPPPRRQPRQPQRGRQRTHLLRRQPQRSLRLRRTRPLTRRLQRPRQLTHRLRRQRQLTRQLRRRRRRGRPLQPRRRCPESICRWCCGNAKTP